MRNVTLLLEDGTAFHGKSFGYEKPVAGEVVFNTAMMGYPESLTDPSYAGQMMVLTYPLVGNYGVPPFSIEPNGIATFMESKGESGRLAEARTRARHHRHRHPPTDEGAARTWCDDGQNPLRRRTRQYPHRSI